MSGRLDGPSLLRPGPLAAANGAARRSCSTVSATVPDDPVSAALFIDGQLGLVDDMLHYFDRMSMAHSLEVRVPFLDHRVVEHCATIPAEFKVRRLQTKAVLKHAARGLVPDRIIDKRKIGFFNASVGGWFSAQASGAISEYLLDPTARYGELLRRTEVERLVAGHLGGAGDSDPHLLLSILMLEIWLSTYLPRATYTGEPEREQIRLPA